MKIPQHHLAQYGSANYYASSAHIKMQINT